MVIILYAKNFVTCRVVKEKETYTYGQLAMEDVLEILVLVMVTLAVYIQ